MGTLKLLLKAYSVVLYPAELLGRIFTVLIQFRRPHAKLETTQQIFNNDFMERVMGIEPTTRAWKALVLPLNYTRKNVDSQWRDVF